MFVDAPSGGRIHVVERGRAGTPLLLLHGFTGSTDAWPAPLLDGLAEGRQLLAVDLPGHGRSDTSRDPRRYEIERVVADLVAVLDEVGAEKADWAGYSMGGRVALAAAVLHPDRVRRVVLESASPGLRTAPERTVRQAADEALAGRITAGFELFVDEWMALPLFAGQQRLGAQWLRKERLRRLEQNPNALAACLRGLGTGSQPPFWSGLSAIIAPVLLIAGSLDAKFVALGMDMKRLLPDAELAVVERAGHSVHVEDPSEWLARITEFLDT